MEKNSIFFLAILFHKTGDILEMFLCAPNAVNWLNQITENIREIVPIAMKSFYRPVLQDETAANVPTAARLIAIQDVMLARHNTGYLQ